MAARWQSAATGQGTAGVVAGVDWGPEGDSPLRLRLEMPHETDGAALAAYLPAGADLSLLRAVVSQAGPQVERTSRLFWQDVRISQPLDLRSAGEQWNAMAASLERQAAELAAPAENDAEAALRRQIQAVNYRTMAESWRRLAGDSWLLYRFVAGVGAGYVAGYYPSGELGGDAGAVGPAASGTAPDETCARYATVKSPPLVFATQTQTVNGNLLGGLGACYWRFLWRGCPACCGG